MKHVILSGVEERPLKTSNHIDGVPKKVKLPEFSFDSAQETKCFVQFDRVLRSANVPVGGDDLNPQ